jgi:hypothetical protein
MLGEDAFVYDARRRAGRAMGTGKVTLPLLETFRRLVEQLLDVPNDVPILAPLLQREVGASWRSAREAC